MGVQCVLSGYRDTPTQKDPPQSMVSSPMDTALRTSVLRFLEALNRPLDAEILGPALVRELYFRMLTGGQAHAIRTALAMQRHFGKIEQVLRRIRSTYTEPFDIAQLARQAGMSMATFHTHFRAVTHTSPMQYVKFTRLHQARLLMVRQGVTAEAACHAVGYESPSQFNREFKRLFGLTPAAETKRMRDGIAPTPVSP